MASHELAPFPPELLAAKKQIREQARAYGLDFYPTIFEMCDYEQMNQIAAYGGFPQRYPHWRFGMEYERLRKQHHYGLGRIYEMVINNDPCYAYLQESNPLVDQKLVIAHVYGHCDFFKNNLWFAPTNRKMMDEMANHSTHIRKHAERVGHDVVEAWLDVCLSIEHLIDTHGMFLNRGPLDEKPAPPGRDQPGDKFKAKDYLDRYINPPAAIAADAKKRKDEAARVRHASPARPTRDVLQYLLDHARLEDWQADCLSIVREESYYFAPQGMTKVMNEGWACITADSLAFTSRGLIRMADVVAATDALSIHDGEHSRTIYDRNVIRDHPIVTIRTRRGHRISGSDNHRVMLADGTWCRLDQIAAGASVRISAGGGLWSDTTVSLDWHPKPEKVRPPQATGTKLVQLADLERAAVAVSLPAAALAIKAAAHASPAADDIEPTALPGKLDRKLSALIGHLICSGNISSQSGTVSFATTDPAEASVIALLVDELFGIDCEFTPGRVLVRSKSVAEFLAASFPIGAGKPRVPVAILQSPKEVVASFLQSVFDRDAYCDNQGITLVTRGDSFSEELQLLLLNFGIVSRRARSNDHCWKLRIAGSSAAVFQNEIGFGLSLKREELAERLAARSRMKPDSRNDEIVSIEHGRADVYDISVENTHRYAAQGFINHNSYWHSTLMTKHFLEAPEVIDYADHHSGTVHMPPGNFNPYKIGIELFRDIEDRWNKGKFGKEYDEADKLGERKKWDTGLGQGREKIFEVRRVYNDVNFIDEFMTPEFIEKHKFYQYGKDPHTGQLRIVSRDPMRIKQTMLYQLTNLGQPFIYVVDGNYANRGELYLAHKHNGRDIEIKFAVETLKSLYKIWQRPVHLQARIDDDMMLFTFNGDQAKQQTIRDETVKPAHAIA